jgi:hypothetical protein
MPENTGRSTEHDVAQSGHVDGTEPVHGFGDSKTSALYAFGVKDRDDFSRPQCRPSIAEVNSFYVSFHLFRFISLRGTSDPAP